MYKYTLELRELEKEAPNKIFDFHYNFYSDDVFIKGEFEQMFKDYYFFNEIGFETIDRFKFALRTKLNLIAPYYKQMYQSIVQSEDRDFLISKDLTETTTRIVNSERNYENENSSNESMDLDLKSSSINNGNANVSLASGDLTDVSNNSSSRQTSDTSSADENATTEEKVIFNSRGDIGIQTISYALKSWREVMININQMMIEECKDLFMQIY